MGLHATERLKLCRIEEDLRSDDPGLDARLAGRPPRREPALIPAAAGGLVGYLVPLAFVLAGLVLHVARPVVAGMAGRPFVPVIAWPVIRHHFVRRWTRRSREP